MVTWLASRKKNPIQITMPTSNAVWTLVFIALIPWSLCWAKYDDDQLRTSYACEGSTLKITCNGNRVIKILMANYGRRHLTVCNDGAAVDDWVVDCLHPDSVDIVANLCQDKQNCWIPATNRMFGDPCGNTPKYLEVRHRCVKDTRTTPRFQTRPPTTKAPTTPRPTTRLTTPKPTTTETTTTTTERTTPKRSSPSTPTKQPVEGLGNCRETYKRNITWRATAPGDTAFEICPNNRYEMAKWRCSSDGSWFGVPDLSRCVSGKTIKLEHDMLQDKPVELGHSMVELTEEDLFGGDVSELTKVMRDLVSVVEEESEIMEPELGTFMVNEVNEAILESGSNLLDAKKNQSWQDLPQSEQRKTATALIQAVESSAEQVAQRITSVPTVPTINIEINIVMQVTVVDTEGAVKDVVFPEENSLKGSTWEKNKDQIRITSGAVKEFSVKGLAKLIFLQYDNINDLLKPQSDTASENDVLEFKGAEEETKYKVSDNGHTVDSGEPNVEVTQSQEKEIVKVEGEIPKPSEEEQEKKNKMQNKIVNSNIISASIPGKEPDDKGMIMLPPGEGVYYTLEHKTTDNVFNPTCSFWEYSEKSLDGEWSDFGCEVVDTNVTHTICSCNHLTNFAVLMDVVGTELASHHRLVLSLITYIGCFVSMICLFFAWLTFQFFKSLQCDRNTIHKNLVLTLFLAEALFLAGIAQYDRPFLCSLVAGMLHYLFLAAFAWMCLEGVQLYVMLIEVFEAEKSRVKMYYLAAFGIPAIIVGISAAVDHTGYGTPDYCWLRIDNGFIWAFVGPVIAVIMVNFVMLSIAIYMMCKHASIAAQYKMKEKSRLDQLRSWLKGAFVLVVLLGLTWTFGLFYISDHTVFMAYLFTIFNSLQGMFIFIFHCVMNEKVQKEYKRWIRHARFLPDSVRIKYGGMKAYTSSSPHSSSTGGNYLQKLWSGRRRKRSSLTSLQRSSTPSTKCEYRQYQNMKVEYNSQDTGGTPVSPTDPDRQVSNFSTEGCTEDPMGYLEPVKIRITDSFFDNDGINGDLSQIEGSVVDSDYLMDYGRKPCPPINVEKYKIKPEDTNRLSAYSNDTKPGEFTESEFSDGELFRMTEKEKMLYSENEYEELPMAPPVPKTVSEENIMNKLNRDSTLKRNLNNESPSLNDLNKEESVGSKDSLCLSTPNINYKTDTMRSEDSNTASTASLPNIAATSSAESSAQGSPTRTSPTPADPSLDKIKKALSNDKGLINLYHGKTEDKRFSKDTENALKANHVRYSSSDC